MTEHDRFRDDCGAYVLGALQEHEVAALREHMESCVPCRDEVDRLAAVTEVLGLGVPTLAAPVELRSRVLDLVQAEAELFAAAGTAPTGSSRPRSWFSDPRRLGGLVGGAALALGVALGALVLAPGGSATKVISASVAPAARWHGERAPVASLRETGTQGELVLRSLPRAPAGEIYEVWVQRNGRILPINVLFDATSSGRATVTVSNLAGASALMVTAERLGGAKAPTMAALIAARLS